LGKAPVRFELEPISGRSTPLAKSRAKRRIYSTGANLAKRLNELWARLSYGASLVTPNQQNLFRTNLFGLTTSPT